MSPRPAARLLLAATAVLLALVAVEAALRLADFDYSPMRVVDEQDDRAENVFDSQAFVYDPVLFWRPRPGNGVFNRQGFRGAEVGAEKPAGALRVVAVGDSNTLGWRGTTGAHWPGDLEDLLRAEDDRHRVINAGVWGYSSHQGAARMPEILALRPDVVLISFGSNDAHPVLTPDRAWTAGPLRPQSWRKRFGQLRLGRLVLGALDRLAAGAAAGAETTARVGLEDYRANLRRMIAMTREAGARPVLLTRPYLDSVPDPPRWKALAPLYNLATVEVAIEKGVPVVDFYTLFKTRDELFADESHFTAEGHLVAAKLLYWRLRPHLAAATAAPPPC